MTLRHDLRRSNPSPSSSADVLRRRVGGALSLAMVTGVAIALPLTGTAQASVQTDSATYYYSGASQLFAVPEGIDALRITATGGSGGDSVHDAGAAVGGAGSTVSFTIAIGPDAPVDNGDRLVITVGGDGEDGTIQGSSGAGGFNGGNWGGGTSGSHPSGPGAGGGGASDVRLPGGQLGDRIAVAAGGGGAGGTTTDSLGGSGGSGGANGGASGVGVPGGQAGHSGHGRLGEGEVGGTGYSGGGGGGGGGYYGGGGGLGSDHWSGSGGGGGSNYAAPGATGVVIVPAGDGEAKITLAWHDTEAPVFAAYEDLVVTATDDSSAVVDYEVPTAHDNFDGDLAATCDPGPGARFPIGATTVTCSAIDRAGNRSTSAFVITVIPNESDLRISVTGPVKARRGTLVTYTLTVTNHGPAAATDVATVLDARGIELDEPDRHLATLASGDFASYDVTATAPAKKGKKITILAFVSASTYDPARSNNRDSLRTKVT